MYYSYYTIMLYHHGDRQGDRKTFAEDVFIDQERKSGGRGRSDTVLVSTINHAG